MKLIVNLIAASSLLAALGMAQPQPRQPKTLFVPGEPDSDRPPDRTT